MDQRVNSKQSGTSQALENMRMRLLDLTARNRLINFRHTKMGSLRVIDELPNQLAESLLSEVEMRFDAIPEPREQELIDAGYLERDESTRQLKRLCNDPSADEWAKHLGFNTSYEVPNSSDEEASEKHSDKAIQTLLFPYEMEARLKALLQASDSAVQEMGANILYLAFGFLEWYENPNSDSSRIAPLFLVPVRLQKGRLNPLTQTYEYTLSYTGEDIIPNLSLREKLRADFAMALPELDENTIPEDYFQEVQALIEDKQPRWLMRRYISLTLLNFSKLLMYLDLDPARWPDDKNIVDHPVVSRFLYGFNQEENEPDSAGELGFGEEYLIDEISSIHADYPLINDADSSQHSALIDAVDGKNLVIEGPPGTGKSQTITNLIAAAMAQGKKVLFVAEKLAALEVVHSRLEAAGLGEFCLELHSHKSQKRKILDDIKTRLNKHGRYRKPKDIEVDLARYEEFKNILKDHAEKINQLWKNTDITLHNIFTAATRYRTEIQIDPEIFHPEGYDGLNYTPTLQRRNEDQVHAYQKVYHAVVQQLDDGAVLQQHPWYGVRNTNLQLFDLNKVKDSLESWSLSLQALQKKQSSIEESLGSDVANTMRTLGDLDAFLSDLEKIPAVQGDEIFEKLPILRNDALLEVQDYLKLFENIEKLYSRLTKTVGYDVLEDQNRINTLISASCQLGQLVRPYIKLHELAAAINNLGTVSNKLEELDEPLMGILNALGEPAKKYLTVSESGLYEFKIAIDLISDLNPAYWNLRDELYDNDVLDELLPKLQLEIEELRGLQKTLKSIFILEKIPAEEEVHQLNSVLSSGGAFRWLSSNWRKARKQLLSYSATPKAKLSEMLFLLDEVAGFSGKIAKFESNKAYKEALGNSFRQLETDLDAVESLRSWYKRVRKEYGVGFGQKVLIGEAILGVPASIAQAVRSLAERGVNTEIDELINTLNDLKSVFLPSVELQKKDIVLSGENGCISKLLSEIRAVIGQCEPLTNRDDMSVAELIELVKYIDILRNSIFKWRNKDCDNKFFDGVLKLNPSVSADNKKGLSILRNTLNLADSIDTQLSNRSLVDCIYQKPEKEIFVFLSSFKSELKQALTTEKSTCSEYTNLVDLDNSAWMIHCGDRVDGLIDRNQLAINKAETLQSWLAYSRQRDIFKKTGLICIADAVESSIITLEQAVSAYKAGVFDLLAREILREDPVLSQFSGHSQEAVQEKFREYDNKLKQLQCEQIAWQVDQAKIPAGNNAALVSQRTEKALLDHESNLKRPRTPMRQLMHRAGKAIVALKPCFMMGPMSVAQYLAPGNIEFDLVVMDEASQIKPQDALGAIARGGQLVVVGDPKQLPPTSFFDRVIDEMEEDPTGIEESESILDATLTMFPARRLRWHYRSQHESLIAFSNYSFYDNDLVLFPSPYQDAKNYGVQYSRLPNGCFVNRRNMEEARVISEAVREHFRNNPEETLGVVAMSADQRLLIERAIETLAKDDPVFQGMLDKDETRHEALFIKNLENVQGDERDVIFISMTYGPQEPGGRVYQRFGPINSDVGWRRLNVLLTRSKKRMHIFSSMDSDDIIVSSTSKRGLIAMRGFLSYCETGIVHPVIHDTGKAPDSDFEIAVMNELHKAGFECKPQVGVSGYFIDLAVVDPGNPGRYLMGIECDGATYHSAKSARDRDRLRQAHLERLDWRIRRIWSTDWFKNPQGELAPIIRELHELKTYAAPVAPELEPSPELEPDTSAQENSVKLPDLDQGSLREQLMRFDLEVIRKELPDTDENKRLLRPTMLETLLEFKPTSTAEFLELIPAYIRQGTEAKEGPYLEQVFQIINRSFAGT